MIALDEVPDIGTLENYYLLPAIRAEILLVLGDRPGAKENLEKAMTLTASPAEKELIQRKMKQLEAIGHAPNGKTVE